MYNGIPNTQIRAGCPSKYPNAQIRKLKRKERSEGSE